MKYKIDNEIININEIILMNIDPDGDLKIVFKNGNFTYIDKKHKKEIEKLINKDNLYISKDLTIYINEIILMEIDSDGDLEIEFKDTNFIYIDKKHKTPIETFNTRNKLNNF